VSHVSEETQSGSGGAGGEGPRAGNGHSDHADGEGARPSPEELLQAALDLVECGMRVFPVHTVVGGRCSCGDATCKDQGKHPRVKAWQDVASSDPATVIDWWKRWPTANIGLATGAASGIVVLDVDGSEGAASLATLEAKYGAIGVTARSQTPRPGMHIVFAHPGFHVGNSTGKRGGIAPGLDVRGDGGYIVVPPSLHLNGKRYASVPGMKIGAVESLPMPMWMAPRPEPERPRPPPRLQLVNDARSTKYGRSALERECTFVRNASEGSRNDQLNASAFALGQLIGGGVLDESEVRAALLEVALAVGLSRREILKTLDSAIAAGIKEPRGVPESTWTPPPPANDVGDPRDPGDASTPPPNADDEPPTTEKQAPSGIEWIGAVAIAAPLPPTRWAVPGLQIGPGRVTLIAGYGASAKTMSAQSMALAKAAGKPIWNHFDCTAGVVLHIDYDQGRHASIKRYQRLALGHEIDLAALGDRLRLAVLPRVFLDERGALDAYLRVCEGVDLVIIDSLRAAAPTTDENDSKFRAWIDMLNVVSDRQGPAMTVLHHAGKPKDSHDADARTIARGSSAIFDASGCVLNFVAKNGDKARHVTQVKMPAEAEGAAVADFDLLVEDVEHQGNPSGAVRVVWQYAAPVNPAERAAAAYQRDAERMLGAVRANQGESSSTIVEKSGVQRTRAFAVLNALVDQGKVVVTPGPRNTKHYRIAVGE
jgi:hypothetical protein